MAGVYFGRMDHDPTRPVLQAVRAAIRASDVPLVLAVSGGLDSMVLLHAAARVARARVAMVATFDHGSGRAGSAAAAFVAREASALGFPAALGRATPGARVKDGREAAWRDDRHEFLRAVAAAVGGQVVTAHTEDDQVETVLMRVLRGSGTRGLAGLYARGPILRPFVHLRRTVLRAFAREHGVAWRDDPTNRSREFLRNRVRLDLLPALRRGCVATWIPTARCALPRGNWRAMIGIRSAYSGVRWRRGSGWRWTGAEPDGLRRLQSPSLSPDRCRYRVGGTWKPVAAFTFWGSVLWWRRGRRHCRPPVSCDGASSASGWWRRRPGMLARRW
jgi:tRNA(Ile)-lysidine synthase